MSLLFDTSADEPQRQKKARRPPVAEEPAAAEVFVPAALVAPLGRLDEGVACLDTSCQAECHDILNEDCGQWRLECCFCGTAQWIPVIRGHLPPPAEGADFVFRGGRFDGQTIAKASRSSRGLDYIRWAAGEHTKPAVKKACETWLASMSAGR